MSHDEPIEIAVEVRQQTDQAMRIFDGARECWIPKSQIVDYATDDHDRITEILIPEWLAHSKGLI